MVESFINRIVFLRICEDREIEKYHTLLNTADNDTKRKLIEMFKEADNRYDSGIFNFTKDTLSLSIVISDDLLVKIINELYYPKSPYVFSVISSNLLGQIYELFLTKRIAIVNGESSIVQKPEVAHDLGVVSTPSFIVDEIVSRTLALVCEGKAPQQIDLMKFADIACGSGSFILEAYDWLLNHYLNYYLKTNNQEKVYRGQGDAWFLTFQEKKRILTNNIFGNRY